MTAQREEPAAASQAVVPARAAHPLQSQEALLALKGKKGLTDLVDSRDPEDSVSRLPRLLELS